MKLLLAILFGILFLSGCDDSELKEEDLSSFKKLDWLQGVWEGKQGDAVLYESWRKKNFRILEGISYTTVDKIRVYSQDMRIEQSNNKIYFILKKQPESDDEVRFELNLIDDNTIEFVNPDEGYPQSIIYTKVKNDRMNVALHGTEGDEQNKSEFSYKKTEDFSQSSSNSPSP